MSDQRRIAELVQRVKGTEGGNALIDQHITIVALRTMAPEATDEIARGMHEGADNGQGMALEYLAGLNEDDRGEITQAAAEAIVARVYDAARFTVAAARTLGVSDQIDPPHTLALVAAAPQWRTEDDVS